MYDYLGQVTSGKRYWQDGTPVAGQQFEYGFDDIGNRKFTGTGGDASGSNVRGDSYTANRLNQYGWRTVNGVLDQIGIANPTAAVTVNGNTAYRKGEYFDYPLTVGNSSAPQYPQVTVASSYPPGQTNKGNIFVPQTPESFGYDADGNITSDGRWSYTWDAENRLIKMESLANAPTGSKRRLEFTYDHQSRRIKSKITNLDTGAVASENNFLYDGWNLLAELNATNNAIIRSYVWGLDLSGSLQGAGGVGGLLSVWDSSTLNNQPSTHFVAYDGNGNVTALVSTQDGNTLARYEYGPFGEVIRSTGPMAKANPFRFSTKYHEDETDLLYYGRRSYCPGLGRWTSPDPISEKGGLNLYGFLRNNPANAVDVLGLEEGDLGYVIYTEIPNAPMSDPRHGAETTEPPIMSVPPGKHCFLCGWRFQKGLPIPFHAIITYAVGISPTDPNPHAPPPTYRDHEMVHVRYSADYYRACSTAWQAVNPFTCVSWNCYRAKRGYLASYFIWQWYLMDANQAQFDYDQTQDDEYRMEAQADRVAAAVALGQVRDAAGKMNAACRGEL